MKRRYFLLVACGTAAVGLSGCSWWNNLTMRSQSPEERPPENTHARLVGDFASATGMQPAHAEAVGLVTGLHGTGSDTICPERDALLEEMKKRSVDNPNGLLASGNVSLVIIQGILRPGIQKGDRFDIDVRVPSQSETKSLRGGYLLPTWLTETATLGNQVRKGEELASAKGPVMVDPKADRKTDRIAMCRGRILGGGICLKTRPLGLVLTPEHKDVRNSSRIANAINKRFHVFQEGHKDGMAKALNNEYIELKVHPRYKENVARYVQVVRALPITETAPERTTRIARLQSELLDPTTSADAALQLEALGPDGIDTLLKGVKSADTEIRFYAAEALAYLDRREAAEPLGEIARDQPAFRVFALTALSAMQDFAAADQLRDLLAVPSAETRYGAFRALWTMNHNDPLVKGELLNDDFRYHVLDVSGQPMVHVTRNRIAEIVLFGPQQELLTPLAVNAGNDIMITSQGGNQITVSKFATDDSDQKRTVSTRVDEVIRAVVELGGTYPDVVQALQEAKDSGALVSRFEVDALPEAGRAYDRIVEDETADGKKDDGKKNDGKDSAERIVKATPASPSPDLFYQKTSGVSPVEGDADDDSADSDSKEKTKPKKGFFGKMFGS
ncbi:MAG: flagellar basal body P-ring protein FlgI [Thermoguttaceae bacterium]|jgi:flagellar basal body P-ring protein FlgI